MKIDFLNIANLHQSIRMELDNAYKRVMDSGWFIMGPEIAAFEAEFAAYSNVKHCIGVGNGLDALHLLLRAYEIGPGDEVIVPSNTFIATWLAVSHCGATPVAVEPDINTHNINPNLISDAITSRTKAVIPVHLYGQPADMDPINHLAQQNGLVVIEDAAQAQGAMYKGRRVGSLGNAAGTSFYPGKNLGALGDGGAVLTNDDAVADKVRRLSNYGSSIKYQHDLAGYNTRLDEIQAAFLREKLKVLDVWNVKRKAIAKLYSELLSSADCITPFVPEYADPVWHLYVIRSKQRDELKTYLEKQGVSTVIHYPKSPHKQACYSGFSSQSFPIAELLAKEVLSLPISSEITMDELQFVSESIKNF